MSTSAAKPARSKPAVASLPQTQIASVAAGFLSRIALHPLDTIKCRVQYLRGTPSASNLASFVFRDGFRNLYRGLAPALLGVMPFSLVYMPGYTAASRVLGPGPLAGAAAGLLGSVVKCPVDTVKKRLQSGVHSGFFSAVRAVKREGRGVGGFYGGWSATIAYDINYSMLQFTFLEAVRAGDRWLHARRAALGGEGKGKGSSGGGGNGLWVGAITGALTSLATEPLDVVRTRMVTQQRSGLKVGGEVWYRNWRHCAREIVRTEGVRALFKGSLPRLVTVSVSSALWLGAYGFMCTKLAEMSQEKERRKAEKASQ